MPSEITHRCVGKKVLELSGIYKDEKDIFYYNLGCIAPDAWKDSSRFKDSKLPKLEKRKYSHFQPDNVYLELYYNFYRKYNVDIKSPFLIGYLVHLMTDFFWRYIMFYNYFNEDGSVRLLDGSSINGENGVRKKLIHDECNKMDTIMSKMFKLKNFRTLTEDELNNLPRLDEIEFDRFNDNINYNNNELAKETNYDLKVFNVDEFVLGINKVAKIILCELINLGIINADDTSYFKKK